MAWLPADRMHRAGQRVYNRPVLLSVDHLSAINGEEVPELKPNSVEETRMEYRKDKHSLGFQSAGNLPDGLAVVLDIHECHIADGNVERISLDPSQITRISLLKTQAIFEILALLLGYPDHVL